jgi:hypothetical protein
MKSTMKTATIVNSSSFKTFGLCVLASLSFAAGMAQADNSSCLLGSNNAAANVTNNATNNAPALNALEARLNQRMEQIEQGLRSGQISPMQAGKMMREQWEAVQFQRGFLEGSRAAGGMNPMAAMGGMGGGMMGGNNAGNNACALTQGINAKQLAAKVAPVVKEMAAEMAPVVSGIAVEGVQTATTVMRALAREAGKLLREDTPMTAPMTVPSDSWF